MATFDSGQMRGHCDWCGMAGECGNNGFVEGPAVQIGTKCVAEMAAAIAAGKPTEGEFGPVATPKKRRVPADGPLRVEKAETNDVSA